MSEPRAVQIDPRTGRTIRRVEVLVTHVSTDTVQVRALNGPMRGSVYEIPRNALLKDTREDER